MSLPTLTTLPATATHRPAAPAQVTLTGRIDAHVVADVQARLDVACADGGDVDIDLADVRFIDGHALAVLRERRQQLQARGRELRIASASAAATIILEMARATGIVGPDELVPGIGLQVAGAAA